MLGSALLPIITLFEPVVIAPPASLPIPTLPKPVNVLPKKKKSHMNKSSSRFECECGYHTCQKFYKTQLYILIPMMMGLGILLRSYNEYLGGYVVVAAIYCGIGMALIVSSRIYWTTEPTAPAPENS